MFSYIGEASAQSKPPEVARSRKPEARSSSMCWQVVDLQLNHFLDWPVKKSFTR